MFVAVLFRSIVLIELLQCNYGMSVVSAKIFKPFPIWLLEDPTRMKKHNGGASGMPSIPLFPHLHEVDDEEPSRVTNESWRKNRR